MSLKSNQKVIGHLYNAHDTAAPVGTSSLAGWNCSIQGPILGKTTDVFSHPAAYTATFSIVIAMQQGRSFCSIPAWFLYDL